MINKIKTKYLTALIITGIVLIAGIVLALQASPVGPNAILTAQTCFATNRSVAVACTGVYPGVCSAGGDKISCSDGINEIHGTAVNNQIARVNMSAFNS